MNGGSYNKAGSDVGKQNLRELKWIQKIQNAFWGAFAMPRVATVPHYPLMSAPAPAVPWFSGKHWRIPKLTSWWSRVENFPNQKLPLALSESMYATQVTYIAPKTAPTEVRRPVPGLSTCCATVDYCDILADSKQSRNQHLQWEPIPASQKERW